MIPVPSTNDARPTTLGWPFYLREFAGLWRFMGVLRNSGIGLLRWRGAGFGLSGRFFSWSAECLWVKSASGQFTASRIHGVMRGPVKRLDGIIGYPKELSNLRAPKSPGSGCRLLQVAVKYLGESSCLYGVRSAWTRNGIAPVESDLIAKREYEMTKKPKKKKYVAPSLIQLGSFKKKTKASGGKLRESVFGSKFNN